MEKILSRILLILNMILIVGLLALSGLLIFATASKPAEIFGHTVVLTEGVSGGTLCIVDLHPTQLLEGDRIVYQAEENMQTATVKQNDGTTLTYLDNTNHLVKTTPKDENIQGLITSENAFLGHILSSLSGSGKIQITYVCIGVGFIFCAIAIFLAYFISSKVNSPVLENASDLSLLRSLLGDNFDQPNEEADEDDSDTAPKPSSKGRRRVDIKIDETDEEIDEEPYKETPHTPRNAEHSKKAPIPAHIHSSPSKSATPFPQLSRVKGGTASPQPPRVAPVPVSEPEPDVKEYIPAQKQASRVSAPPTPPPVPQERSVRPERTPVAPAKPIYDDDYLTALYPQNRDTSREKPSPGAVRPAPSASPVPPSASRPVTPPKPPTPPAPTVSPSSKDAYDLYDVLSPSIDDLLNDIEKEFKDLR